MINGLSIGASLLGTETCPSYQHHRLNTSVIIAFFGPALIIGEL